MRGKVDILFIELKLFCQLSPLRATGRAGGEGKDGGYVHKGLLSATMISVSDMMEDEFVCLSDYGNLPPFDLK